MNRINVVKEYIDGIFDAITCAEERKIAYVHTYGVAEYCAFIAVKRGLNPEVSYISGLWHDVYAYKTGVRSLHSHNGADMARPVLRDMKIFTDEEQKLILSAYLLFFIIQIKSRFTMIMMKF